MAGALVADLAGVVPVLGVAWGVVVGAVVLVTGWELCSQRTPRRRRRGGVVPPVGATAQDSEGAR